MHALGPRLERHWSRTRSRHDRSDAHRNPQSGSLSRAMGACWRNDLRRQFTQHSVRGPRGCICAASGLDRACAQLRVCTYVMAGSRPAYRNNRWLSLTWCPRRRMLRISRRCHTTPPSASHPVHPERVSDPRPQGTIQRNSRLKSGAVVIARSAVIPHVRTSAQDRRHSAPFVFKTSGSRRRRSAVSAQGLTHAKTLMVDQDDR